LPNIGIPYIISFVLTGPCPPDPEETAEAYILCKLPARDAENFEDHYVGCARCIAILQKTAVYVESMAGAARTLRSKGLPPN